MEKIRCEVKLGVQEALKASHRSAEIARVIKKTVIGYDFSFEISEDNNASKGKLHFERAGFRKDSRTIWELTGSAARTRKNKRDFRIIERLSELKDERCGEGEGRANWIYPIVGSIGLNEVVRTYIKLELLTRFRGDEKTKVGKYPVVFSDELAYTTEFGGGIQPTLELATIAGKVRLSNATLFAEAKRKDVHSVTVALAQDGVVDPLTQRMFMMELRIPNAALAQTGASTTTGVLSVVGELERRRSVREDERVNTKLLEALRLAP